MKLPAILTPGFTRGRIGEKDAIYSGTEDPVLVSEGCDSWAVDTILVSEGCDIESEDTILVIEGCDSVTENLYW